MRIHSVAGVLPPSGRCSPAAVPGAAPQRLDGGDRRRRHRPRPGEASLAHRGVLLLDELPEFQRPALEALRQPLEDGVVAVARVQGQALFPARFQLVATMNPVLPGAATPPRVLVLAAAARRLPRQALAGAARPLRPRRHRAAAACGELAAGRPSRPRPSATRVAAAVRAAAGARRTAEADELLSRAVERLPLSGRGRARVARVARTAAALAGADAVLPEHVAEALAYRSPKELAA